MSKEKDTLTTCSRCSSNACYEQSIPNSKVRTWLCMTCGFTTSTLMLVGSKLVKEVTKTSPDLYKDLLFEDKENRVWTPSTITLPGKGMVFIDGTDKNNWKWKAVKALPLTVEEKESNRYPKGQEIKMDVQNANTYDQSSFMDAMEEIGAFKQD